MPLHPVSKMQYSLSLFRRREEEDDVDVVTNVDPLAVMEDAMPT